MHSYEALLLTHFNIILPTVLWRTIRNKITHLYSFFPCLTLSWHTLIINRIFIIEIKLDFASFNDKHHQRRRKFVAECDFPTKLLYWSGLMSESQQGPEICDVISGKHYWERLLEFQALFDSVEQHKDRSLRDLFQWNLACSSRSLISSATQCKNTLCLNQTVVIGINYFATMAFRNRAPFI